MHDRPMVVVRLTDHNGIAGYGEAWCNFPAIAAEYRARIIDAILGPTLLDRDFETAVELGQALERTSRLIALQAGEHGPFASCLAALDSAFHDLRARQARLPLCAMLGAFKDSVPVYASGINPEAPDRVVETLLRQGWSNFKFKVGFGRDLDLANLRAVRDVLRQDEPLAIDANQGWDLPTAIQMMMDAEQFNLTWVEEPLPVDAPAGEWKALAAATSQRLAGGENLMGAALLMNAAADGVFDILQPDLAKWGGISGCQAVAQEIQKHGRHYYPHFLGGGIGLVASAHLLAAVGGSGLLEVDVNQNPLRSGMIGDMLSDPAFGMKLHDAPGLGFEPDLEAIATFKTHYYRQDAH